MKSNKDLFEEAQKYIPGGVNSPARAFKSVGGVPPFIKKAKGAYIWDEEEKKYIDYVFSWGPCILGHAHPDVLKETGKVMENGTSFGAPTEIEIKMAELIIEMVPSVDKVRMVNSGTEATMSAVRLARAYTKKDKIIKFSGCYHGHSDSFLIQAGSGGLTLSIPNSPGVTEKTASDTLLAEYNDIESVEVIINENKGQIAAVIIEPIAGNMGCIPPEEGFLQGLRDLTANENILLIFDEVITGFRVAPGGAQELYGIMPDITTLGKIIGGGFPVGAYGGKKEIMAMVAPDGPVYQAGTLSGNPVAMTAGYATLKILKDNPRFYDEMAEKSKLLEQGVKENMKKFGKNYYYTRVGSMNCLFFIEEKVINMNTATKTDTELFSKYFHSMLEKGVYLPCSQFETVFISMAHSEEDIQQTVRANYESFKEMFE